VPRRRERQLRLHHVADLDGSGLQKCLMSEFDDLECEVETDFLLVEVGSAVTLRDSHPLQSHPIPSWERDENIDLR
jgi:hypothetical protein